MNKLEKRMVELLVEMKERYHVCLVKAEFEAEGTRMEEAMRLKEVSMKAGLGMAIKVGGCEAIKDMFEANSLGVNHIVAPMVETAYALRKYIKAVRFVFSEEERQDKKFLVNIETATAVENLPRMIELPEINYLDGVVLGRTDLTGSLGMSPDDINRPEILAIALKVAAQAHAAGLDLVIGGGVSVQSQPFFRSIPAGQLTRFETRKIVFQCPGALGNPEEAFLKAVEFELLWLRNKKNYYGAIHREDDTRVATMEERYRKAIEAIYKKPFAAITELTADMAYALHMD